MSLILFVAYGGGHVAMLSPVVQSVASRGYNFTFLALTTARSTLDRLKIPSIGFRDLPEATEPSCLKWGYELCGDQALTGPVSAEETLAYHGASFRDLVDLYGEKEARRRFDKDGRQAFLPVATMRRAISRMNPSLVVATNSPRAERAAIIAASQLGIPSICAVDLFAFQEVQWIGEPGYATKVCVLNESVRDMLITNGRKSDEVIVTGNPAFDCLTSPETIKAGKLFRQDKGWNDDLKTILWASQVEPALHPFADTVGDPSLPRRIENQLRSIVASNPKLRLVVRYHPSEQVEFKPEERVVFSPLSEPISVLLHAVDAVVITASTVGVEAAIAGRPVVSIDMSIFTPDTQYAALGVSRGITDLNLLGQALNEALSDRGGVFTQGKLGMTATQAVLRVMDSLLV